MIGLRGSNQHHIQPNLLQLRDVDTKEGSNATCSSFIYYLCDPTCLFFHGISIKNAAIIYQQQPKPNIFFLSFCLRIVFPFNRKLLPMTTTSSLYYLNIYAITIMHVNFFKSNLPKIRNSVFKIIIRNLLNLLNFGYL